MIWIINWVISQNREQGSPCCHLSDFYEHNFKLQPAVAKHPAKITAEQYLKNWRNR